MSNKNGSKWIRPEKRRAIYRRDDFTCVYCGAHAEDGVQMSLDHVTPRELGGSNHETNLVTACVCCNSAKQDLPMRQFLAVLADKGINAESVKKTIRNATKRNLRWN